VKNSDYYILKKSVIYEHAIGLDPLSLLLASSVYSIITSHLICEKFQINM